MVSHAARWAATLAAGIVAVLGAGAAAGSSTAPDVAATPFATGFTADSDGIGPVGMAFDTAGRLIVSERDQLYRFGREGGPADAAHRMNRAPLPGAVAGLTIGRDGGLYAALRRTRIHGDV